MKKIKFGNLLKAGLATIAHGSNKTALSVESDLGELLGLSHHSIQRYKSGHIPTNANLEKIIKVIVEHGMLGKKWFKDILEQAEYPYQVQLLDTLFPPNMSSVNTYLNDRVVLENLPAPTYGDFVERRDSYNQLVSVLSERWRVIVVRAIGGMGKSCLVREVLYNSIYKKSTNFNLQGLVWIKADKRGEKLTLNNVLDEIAYVLKHPGITSLKIDDKTSEINHVLRRMKVIIVIDGAEEILSNDIFIWMKNIPEPSKCVVTSRVLPEVLKDFAYHFELKGMDASEIKDLAEVKMRQINISITHIEESVWNNLLMVSGGNPKAIEGVLGYMKHNNKCLNDVVFEFAKGSKELFDDIFSNCWKMVNPDGVKILTAISFFPYSANHDALLYISGVGDDAFKYSIERLTELSLLDVIYNDVKSKPRYALHNLVNTFVKNQTKELISVKMPLRERWVHWYCELSAKIGFCWNDIRLLELLDEQGEREGVKLVISWCIKNGWFDKAIQICKDVRYYFYVRGIWAAEPSVNLQRYEAAKAIGDKQEQFSALLYHINIAAKQGNTEEIYKYINIIDDLTEEVAIPENMMVDYRHVKGLSLVAIGKLNEAIFSWEENLGKELSDHALNANKRWYANCLYRLGELEKAELLLDEVLKHAKDNNFERGVISAELNIAWIYYEKSQYQSAKCLLKGILDKACSISDERAIAEVCYCLGCIELEVEDYSSAIQHLDWAIEKYERLGMKNIIAEIKELKNVRCLITSKN